MTAGHGSVDLDHHGLSATRHRERWVELALVGLSGLLALSTAGVLVVIIAQAIMSGTVEPVMVSALLQLLVTGVPVFGLAAYLGLELQKGSHKIGVLVDGDDLVYMRGKKQVATLPLHSLQSVEIGHTLSGARYLLVVDHRGRDRVLGTGWGEELDEVVAAIEVARLSAKPKDLTGHAPDELLALRSRGSRQSEQQG